MKMKSILGLIIFSVVLSAKSASAGPKDTPNRITHQEQVSSLPNKTCNSSTEDDVNYNSANPDNVWICKSSQWIPYQLSLSIGLSKHVSGKSCRQIRDVSTNDCLPSKLYWVQEMEVYCEMNTTLDKGGWMLVWQHSYMEDLPLNTNMTFFSDYYKPCTQHITSWCNIPNKARFNPTEQMIVAYHNKIVVYAYKGVFNRNIDYDWTGAILMVHTKIIDRCIYNNGARSNPVNIGVPGISFSKYDTLSYSSSYGTIGGTLTSPNDYCWYYCDLPSSISRFRHTEIQMTLAIYVC